MRLAVVTIGGWYWVTVLHGALEGLFWIIAASLVLFGVCNLVAFAIRLHGESCLRSRLARSQHEDLRASGRPGSRENRVRDIAAADGMVARGSHDAIVSRSCA